MGARVQHFARKPIKSKLANNAYAALSFFEQSTCALSWILRCTGLRFHGQTTVELRRDLLNRLQTTFSLLVARHSAISSIQHKAAISIWVCLPSSRERQIGRFTPLAGRVSDGMKIKEDRLNPNHQSPSLIDPDLLLRLYRCHSKTRYRQNTSNRHSDGHYVP
jgi:hypothetical protein